MEAADRQQVLQARQSPDFKTVKSQSVKKGNRYERIQDNS
jgi:hypothetical protein